MRDYILIGVITFLIISAVTQEINLVKQREQIIALQTDNATHGNMIRAYDQDFIWNRKDNRRIDHKINLIIDDNYREICDNREKWKIGLDTGSNLPPTLR